MRTMKTVKKHGISKLLAIAMAVAMAVTITPSVAFAEGDGESGGGTQFYAPEDGLYPKSPRECEGTTLWDCVYFGEYWMGSDGNGSYKKEPVRWRVLEASDYNGDGVPEDALLLSDLNLE